MVYRGFPAVALRFLAVAAVGAATPALAQNTTIVPGAEQFSLPPGNSQATPTPTPVPTLAPPVVALPPAPVRTPTPTPSPRATPTPAPSARASAVPTPRPSATSGVAAAPAPSPTATPAPVPVDQPPAVAAEPIVAASPTPTATSAATESPQGPPSWLWWLGGVLLLGALGLFAWRRLSANRAEPIAYTPEPSAPPTPRAPTPPAAPVTATATPPAAAASVIGIDLRPQRLWTRGPDAHLAFELLVTNTGAAPLSGIRPVIALASAGPDTAAEVVGFAAGVGSMPSGEPFDLRPGETRTLAGELTLPGDRMHVTTASDREMIVPVALVGLTWRGGLSVASSAEAFVIGTGDTAAARLGPVWVDRAGQVFSRLDARRFTPPRS